MATTALDSAYESETAKPPISVHPAFPVIVALWFAALLGLGSLVLPAVLLDRMVSGTGLASLIPAASPPLGMTARAIIAIGGALTGAGLGFAIARRVARAHGPKAESRVGKLTGGAGARRPISVHDELGGEGLINGEGLPISRRRALAISEDDRPSDFLYRAPLPGEDLDAPAPFAAAPIVAAVADDEPLELRELAREDVNDPAFAEPVDDTDPDETHGDHDMTESREPPSDRPSTQLYQAEPEVERTDELDARKNLASRRGLEPLPFAAPSLARRAPQVEVAFGPEGEPEVQLEAVEAPASETAEFRADWQTAPLDGLGLVQLVQRLGSTIGRRRERMAQTAAQPPAAPPAAPVHFAQTDFEPAAAEDAVQAMAAFFGSASADEPELEQAPADEPPEATPASGNEATPTARPEFLRPLSVPDEDDIEEAVPDFSLPLRRPVVAAPSSAPADNDAEEDGDAEGEGESGYSSLLGMSNPFAAPKNEFVRIEEPEEEAEPAEPAVVFPGQEGTVPAAGGRLFDPPGKAATTAAPAPQAPADADAALRAALATLQRMSGAA